MHPTWYPTHISFIPSRSTFPFLKYGYKRIDIENPRSRPWWGQSLKSQLKSNILSTHIPLVPCQSALPFLRYSIFKVWPWKSKVKVIAEGHTVGMPPYRFISFSFHVDWPYLPSLGYSYLKIWHFKIQGQGYGWGQSWKSQHGSNIQSTHIPFVPCKSAVPFMMYGIFKIWP